MKPNISPIIYQQRQSFNHPAHNVKRRKQIRKSYSQHYKYFWIFGTDGPILLRSFIFYLFCVLISRYSITITLINLPSLILAAMTRMRIMMMRQLTRVIFLRLFSVWDTQPPAARLARPELSSPEITPSTSGSGAEPESEKRCFHFIQTWYW